MQMLANVMTSCETSRCYDQQKKKHHLAAQNESFLLDNFDPYWLQRKLKSIAILALYRGVGTSYNMRPKVKTGGSW